MEVSAVTRMLIGFMIITIPTIEFGGSFLLSQVGKKGIIKSDIQRAFFRAGHAHAGALVTLGIICQLMVELTTLADGLAWIVRFGLVAAPMLISAGFFLGAPMEGTQPRRLIALVYIGAVILVAAMLILGLGLLFQ